MYGLATKPAPALTLLAGRSWFVYVEPLSPLHLLDGAENVVLRAIISQPKMHSPVKRCANVESVMTKDDLSRWNSTDPLEKTVRRTSTLLLLKYDLAEDVTCLVVNASLDPPDKVESWMENDDDLMELT